MDKNQTADTPLELYEKAYKLHYQEYKIAEACAIYRQLIEKFPDSRECGYAVIQLNKIESNKVAKRLLQSSTVSPRISYAALIIGIVSLVITLSVLILFSVEFNNREKEIAESLTVIRSSVDTTRQEINNALRISRALGALVGGNDDHALEILRTVQSSGSPAIASYSIAADIYLQKKQYKKAIAEYENLRNIFPELEFIPDKIAMIKSRIEPVENDTAREEAANIADSNHPKSGASLNSAQQKSSESTFKKSLLVVDSVEFF
ncbi:MAG: tetratricopeptide repeat protein [Chitinivibrionales bacterium]|nr:tetratricopeptide repeat protein [Chitinivibrionales bacterium]